MEDGRLHFDRKGINQTSSSLNVLESYVKVDERLHLSNMKNYKLLPIYLLVMATSVRRLLNRST